MKFVQSMARGASVARLTSETRSCPDRSPIAGCSCALLSACTSASSHSSHRSSTNQFDGSYKLSYTQSTPPNGLFAFTARLSSPEPTGVGDCFGEIFNSISMKWSHYLTRDREEGTI